MILDDDDAPRRALVVAVQLPGVDDQELNESMTELRRLARTLGLEVTASLSQRRDSFDAGAYLGSGKREELKALVDNGVGDVILVDHELSPSQARNLETECGAPVYDRTAVILDIFHRHARSRAAKAQVEIVRLHYLAPRLRDNSKGKDRQRGGIGGKGAGESSLELDRRKIRDRIAELTEQLEALDQERKTQRARRSDLARVALIGYTNAGKSTLMRALTASDVYIADKLFATLDTTVRSLTPESKPRVLVSDTVGFIRNLPHGLVASFKSTLDEALEASLLLHVVDAADPGFERQIEVTNQVLTDIGAGEIPHVYLFNKIDRVEDEAATTAALQARWPESLVISAKRPEDVARVRQAVIDFFNKDITEADLLVPYDKQALRGEIFADTEVLGESYDEAGVTFKVKARPEVLERLRGRL